MVVEPLARETVAEKIETLSALDAVAEPLQQAVRAVIPNRSKAKDALSGTWLGHPVHPPLTDLVVGSWTSALLLDLLGGEGAEDAAERLVGVGVLAALPTALAGLSDWADVRGGSRRVGTLHAIGNTTALTLHVLSWFARRSGNRSGGILLSGLGVGAASFSAWLGGHLAFGRGVGVNETAFDSAPTEWTAVLDEHELEDGALVGVHLASTPLLLVRRGDQLHALDDRCSHRGCSLHEGKLEDDLVVCRCHGSTFRLDGSIVRGPATAPQPRYDVRANDGRIEIRAAAHDT
jgi:nitrite reductase/ring-hydroxylating ferredoxin subunit